MEGTIYRVGLPLAKHIGEWSDGSALSATAFSLLGANRGGPVPERRIGRVVGYERQARRTLSALEARGVKDVGESRDLERAVYMRRNDKQASEEGRRSVYPSARWVARVKGRSGYVRGVRLEGEDDVFLSRKCWRTKGRVGEKREMCCEPETRCCGEVVAWEGV